VKSLRFVCLLLLVSVVVLFQSNPHFPVATVAAASTSPLSIFGPFTFYPSGGSTVDSVAVADVNGDDKLDVITTNDNEPTVGVLLGNGDGTLQPVVTYPSGGTNPVSVAVADVNGDGKPDLIVANKCDTTCSTPAGSVSVLLGNGDGTFQAAVPYSTGGYVASSVVVSDVNGDGKPDLLVANQCNAAACVQSTDGNGSVAVLFGNGDGTFQLAVAYSSGGSLPLGLAVADINGDGKPDLVVTNECPSGSLSSGCPSGTDGSVAVLLNNGNGTFQTAATNDSGAPLTDAVAVADVNGDGKPDLLVGGGICTYGSCTGPVGVLLGKGNGTFQTAVTYSGGKGAVTSIAVADINGDGNPDLLVAIDCPNIESSICNFSSVGQLLGNGDGTFRPATQHGNGGVLTPSSLKVADLNGDGKPDVVVANQLCCAGVLLNTSQTVATVPSALAFGNTTLPTSFTRGVMLTSAGNRPLTITSVALTGPNSGDFVESNNCITTLQPLSQCTVKVTFTPSATGARSATLVVTDNASNSPQQISITGAGVIPAVTLSSTTLTFPTQVVYLPSTSQSVTLTNSGVGELYLSNVAVSVNGQYIETTGCEATINPGAQCKFTVIFEPTTIGSQTGTITLTDNAPGGPQVITFNGVGTTVQLEPRAHNFGIQPVGTTSTAQVTQLSSKSGSAISITSISITGANPGDFIQTNNCGTSVAPGASCYISIEFKPTATGTRTATLTIVDNAGGSPLVTLTGKGI
jgi:hypothetical protein